MKRYANASLLYALIAMAGGVFYREFTKLNGFTGKTTLSVFHTHYFLLGMVVFLLLLLSEKVFAFSGEKTGITGAALFARGITQVLAMPLSRGADAAISGIAGIGHMLLGISLVLLLLAIRKKLRTPCPNHRRKAHRRPLASAGFAGPGRKRTEIFSIFLSFARGFIPRSAILWVKGLRSPLCPPEAARRECPARTIAEIGR